MQLSRSQSCSEVSCVTLIWQVPTDLSTKPERVSGQRNATKMNLTLQHRHIDFDFSNAGPDARGNPTEDVWRRNRRGWCQLPGASFWRFGYQFGLFSYYFHFSRTL